MVNSVYRSKVMSLVRNGYWTNEMASLSLGVSYRQIQRLKHKDFTLPPISRIVWNCKSREVTDLVVLAKEEYPYRSNQRIAELVSDRLGESLCGQTVRKILIEKDKYSPKGRPQKVYSRFEATGFGELLQLDTTEGAWLLGYRRVYLILLLDDYSRKIVGARFVDSDSTWNNMLVIREVLEEYGKPSGIYTDNSSKFKTIRHNKSMYQNHRNNDEYETEIQGMMRELNIPFFSHKPYEPQSKGKIERLFRFIQERFISEHTAETLDELNFQFAVWVKWYNSKHKVRTTGKIPKERVTPKRWTPLLKKDDLDRIFCFKSSRKIDRRHEFVFDGETYALPKDPCVAACRINLEITPEIIRCCWNGQLLEVFIR
ncbi:MAG: DDE-type integrase/transposase/recombinase [Chloroflexi bacterium]|nr:DDE-type integrase/transposase/recombinase [Chloroflexota bacterium]